MERRNPYPRKVTARCIVATIATEIALKTIPGNPTTHSLLNDLTTCQARRMRGLDVLNLTLPFGAQSRTRDREGKHRRCVQGSSSPGPNYNSF